MVKKFIKSSQNPFIKQLVQLRKSKKSREEQNKLLVSGKNLLRDLSKDFSFLYFITTPEAPNILSSDFPPRFTIQTTLEIIKKITHLTHPEPYLAVLDIPNIPLKRKKRLLVLDQIKDPGNLGSLLRSALAFSFDGVLLTENTVDPFNDKTLRSAKGAHFYLPIIQTEKKALIEMAKEENLQLFIADAKGEDLSHQTLSHFMLVLSNEAHGISSWEFPHKKISIPINKKVDSLNVASCGAIFMFYANICSQNLTDI